MDEATKFLILAIEGYKLEKNMHGKDVVALFEKYGVTGYILEYHQVLHCQGIKALVWDIDDFIAHHPLEENVDQTYRYSTESGLKSTSPAAEQRGWLFS
jgi:hypothetical protein